MSMNFMKVGDAAATLGVSEQAVRLWCRTGVLPAYRPAGTKKWLIDPDEFDVWIKRRPVAEVVESLHAPYRSGRDDADLVEEMFAQRDESDEFESS